MRYFAPMLARATAASYETLFRGTIDQSKHVTIVKNLDGARSRCRRVVGGARAAVAGTGSCGEDLNAKSGVDAGVGARRV
jgi:hypothetical protein